MNKYKTYRAKDLEDLAKLFDPLAEGAEKQTKDTKISAAAKHRLLGEHLAHAEAARILRDTELG